MITCYTVPEIWRVTDVIVIFHFVLFFYPNSPKNQNFMKMKKTPENIIIFHICSKNYDQMMYSSWDMVHDRWTDRQTVRRKKWHIEVGAPPKNVTSEKKSSVLHYFYGIFQPFAVDCFCVFQRKNEGFHLWGLSNEVEDNFSFCHL